MLVSAYIVCDDFYVHSVIKLKRSQHPVERHGVSLEVWLQSAGKEARQ